MAPILQSTPTLRHPMSARTQLKFLARLWDRFWNHGPTATLYFHSPCFDGIVSAVLAWDFAEAVLKWKVGDLQPVNYQRRTSWLSQPLHQPCAVVDFLYHPQATFWADHHSTAFLTAEAEDDFEHRRSPYLIYDDAADACAKLLWDQGALEVRAVPARRCEGTQALQGTRTIGSWGGCIRRRRR